MALKGGSQGNWDRRQEVWTLLSLPLCSIFSTYFLAQKNLHGLYQ